MQDRTKELMLVTTSDLVINSVFICTYRAIFDESARPTCAFNL
jgi:hypothetical protein